MLRGEESQVEREPKEVGGSQDGEEKDGRLFCFLFYFSMLHVTFLEGGRKEELEGKQGEAAQQAVHNAISQRKTHTHKTLFAILDGSKGTNG